MRARALILLMHTLTLAVPLTAGWAEECDPHLLVRSTNPYGYRLRGDRCEGLYVEEVGGAPLLIASWTESFLDYGLHSKQPLQIEWEAPHGTGDIRLRAQGLRRRLYYRMDTVRPSGSSSFAWPSDLLAGIGIPKRDVGVVGVTQVPVSATQREVYLPLRISQGGKVAAQPISYRLVLLPGVELSEVFITMVSVTGNGGTILKDAEAVGYGYYPAERPVEITVSNIPAPGFYHLEVGATAKSGGSATAEFWFYHSGN
jgi:hypothetical protein